MSWLYSIILAGLMFSGESAPPFHANYGFTESNTKNVVRLDETERFEQTYPLNADGRVSVSNVNGSISVETWGREEVKLEYVKTADDRDALADLVVKIDAKPDFLRVETDQGKLVRNLKYYGGERKNYYRSDVNYHLIVPKTAVLDRIETVNGSVTIINAANFTKASAVNGVVKATNLRGAANLSTVNGTVEADFDQLRTGGKISLNTVNGQAKLVIPSDANATVRADSLNGDIENDFNLPVRKGQYVGRNLYGRIGSGDTEIRLNSVNGGLTIRRKNDGRNPNPAINLLPQSSSEDFDGDVSVDTAKVNRDIAKAMNQAQKEMDKIKPEFERLSAEAARQAMAINTEKFKQAQARQAEVLKRLPRLPDANWMFGSPIIEEKSDSFAVKDVPKITIEANDCAVGVRGWDKPEVRYSVTKIGRRQDQTPLDVQATQTGADVFIKVSNDNHAPEYLEANGIRLEIYVPKKSNLKIAASGEIRLEGVTGEIELNGEDKAINVRDSGGKIRLTAADGRIRVLGFTGDVYAQTADGDVNLEGNFQKLFARTEDGAIILTLPENADANLAVNKDIFVEKLNLTKEKENTWRVGKGGADYQLQTGDGNVYIRGAAAMKTN